MAKIELTSNLARHLDCPSAEAAGATLREVLDAYFAAHPRSRRYILDDQGGLQRHMIAFVGDRPAKDRRCLSDPVAEGQTVFIFQALSGG